jgi:O-antigen/teichoic acid export membrane protein
VGVFGNRFIQFAITVVLARLLLPAEFGMVALLTVFTTLAAALLDSGFGAALIQRQTVTREDESAVFHFNLAMAVVLYAALWFLAGPIARFFGQPTLEPLARVMALIFFFNAFGLVQDALLTKQLAFRRQTAATMWATALSGAVGVAMAVRGWGVWSLAAQAIANAACRSALLWCYSPWRPLWRFRPAALGAMFPYGSRLLAAGLVGALLDNVYALLIGRYFLKADVGFYDRAQTTQRLAADSLTGVLVKVSLPAYAAVQHDPEQLRQGYRRSILYSSVVIFPLMLGLAAMARPLFLLLFSATWAPSIPYFRVLCLSGLLFHLQALNLNVLKATGRSDLLFRLAVVKVVLVLAGATLAVRFGVTGLVWTQVVVAWLALAINAFYSGRLIRYPLREQLREVWPYALTGAVGAGLTLAASRALTNLPLAAQVGALAFLHLGAYLLLARLFRLAAPFELGRRLLAQVCRARTGGPRP